MVSLEKVFIANVVMYIDTIETALLLIQVNKKCKDALEILHINPGFANKLSLNQKLKEDDLFEYFRVLSKEISLFPHIQTFVLQQRQNVFLGCLPYLPKESQLVMKLAGYVSLEEILSENYLMRIVEVDLMFHSDLQLTVLINLKKVRLTTLSSSRNVIQCFGNDQVLNYARVYFNNTVEQSFIDGFTQLPISNRVVVTLDASEFCKLKENSSFTNKVTICIRCYDDVKAAVPVVDLLNRKFIKTFETKVEDLRLSIPSSIIIQKDSNDQKVLDLRTEKYVESVDVLANNIVLLPQTLTKLGISNAINKRPEYNQLLNSVTHAVHLVRSDKLS
ncbi:hypothetical protein EIN_308770 [Entamoeba invadens IP1]|uniref:Uncharacterized protein n=1 Tax=Entamoeba invadens IP1 TaxID=370355 RepID=A0A0A1U4V2_ENTIV|nr:hypothetical protein EIN_308770 [Entamoeba invadens IP1]ELP86761.1 hypothetical protein EIN_308770 [Entamoeba invadens IP1]|eukprot:XP_004186107.1 hypothetical protein EIN_308770 [Entamoeba invadens IP1]